MGPIVYLRGHEGRGIGLAHKLAAYNLQDQGLDPVDANTALGVPIDARECGTAAQILGRLGVTRLRLITNNPQKCAELTDHGLQISERVVLASHATAENQRHLRTKRERLVHLLGGELDDAGPH